MPRYDDPRTREPVAVAFSHVKGRDELPVETAKAWLMHFPCKEVNLWIPKSQGTIAVDNSEEDEDSIIHIPLWLAEQNDLDYVEVEAEKPDRVEGMRAALRGEDTYAPDPWDDDIPF